MTRAARWFATLVAVVSLLSLAGAMTFVAGGTQLPPATPETSATPSVPAVVRAVLAAELPATAPGQELQLVRYVIQPDTRLATHVHPGTQIASIEAGVLTYTVLTGEVPVTRAVAGGTPTPVETVRAGQTTRLHPGDAVIERPGVVHFGANKGAEPVVILAATLLTAGQSAAIPVNDLGTPMT
ncbi:MAG: cupin domain-containing protein [Chloroflexia bacterium]|nr:cupin domain-containing protein [Chloroflexia bacterium]